jgi:hypothetical protein
VGQQQFDRCGNPNRQTFKSGSDTESDRDPDSDAVSASSGSYNKHPDWQE